MRREARWAYALVLALATAAASLGGCGVRTELLDPWTGAASPADDAGSETVVPVEDHPDTGATSEEADVAERPQLGACTFDDLSIACLPGDVCHANYVVGPTPFICGPSGDPSTPCGLIACGAACACADATSSTCRCE